MIWTTTRQNNSDKTIVEARQTDNEMLQDRLTSLQYAVEMRKKNQLLHPPLPKTKAPHNAVVTPSPAFQPSSDPLDYHIPIHYLHTIFSQLFVNVRVLSAKPTEDISWLSLVFNDGHGS